LIAKDDNSTSGSETETSEGNGSEDEVDSIDECDMPHENHDQKLIEDNEIVATNDTEPNNDADDPQKEIATIVDTTSLGDGLSVVEVCCVGVSLCVAFRPFSVSYLHQFLKSTLHTSVLV
jgi:hypothetical protein